MKISLEQLRPKDATFELKGKKYTIRKYDLQTQIWAAERYKDGEIDGQLVIAESLLRIARGEVRSIDIARVTSLVYEMLIDKSDFDDTAAFTARFSSEASIARILVPVISESIGNAQPVLDEDEVELKKPRGLVKRVLSHVGLQFTMLLPAAIASLLISS